MSTGRPHWTNPADMHPAPRDVGQDIIDTIDDACRAACDCGDDRGVIVWDGPAGRFVCDRCREYSDKP